MLNCITDCGSLREIYLPNIPLVKIVKTSLKSKNLKVNMVKYFPRAKCYKVKIKIVSKCVNLNHYEAGKMWCGTSIYILKKKTRARRSRPTAVHLGQVSFFHTNWRRQVKKTRFLKMSTFFNFIIVCGSPRKNIQV